jgi:microcompartment protein CcmK/EutM
MRIGRVIGNVTCSRRVAQLPAGSLLLVEALDGQALAHHDRHAPRLQPMSESLVVFDQLGAGMGQIIAFSEGGEAAMPFAPRRVPVDAYCAAILDSLDMTDTATSAT